MYEKKPGFTNENEFEKIIKDEFGMEFKRTIEAWGKQRMPSRTIEKLKTLASRSGDQLFSVGMNILESYVSGKIV